MSAPTPAISAVIPTRDRAELLRDSLSSLAAQNLSPDDFEVVVVDDGSADHTEAVCADLATRTRLTYQRIEPSGISAAKNLGVFVATAPIVLFFDDDDVAAPDLLAQHLRTHAANPDRAVAVLGHTTWAPHLEVTELMRWSTEIGKMLFDYTCLTDGDVLDHTFFWGGRASCKRMLLATEGIFDPELRFGSEDIELGYRLQRHGFKVVYNASARSFMNRPITFDEFCRRCERQGRSQDYFGAVLHGDDSSVRRYCDVDDARARLDEVRDTVPAKVQRVRELELLVAIPDHPQAESWKHELHRLYGDVFRIFKLKGLVAAMDER